MHTLTRARWTLRTGLDIRDISINFGNMGFRTPNYTFSGVVGPNGLLGAAPGQPQATALVASGLILGLGGGPTTPLRGWRSLQQEYFTQFDWRASDRLTLNLGLRYGHFGTYSEANGAFANLYAVNNGRIVADVSPFEFGRTSNDLAPTAGERRLYAPDRNNFQPRLGAAYRLDSAGRTVLRAAWGIYHDRLVQLSMSNMTNNPPFALDGAVSNVPFRLTDQVPFNPRGTPPTIFAIDPTLRNPWTQRYNAGVERALGAHTAIQASYVGSRAYDLMRYVEPNFGSAFPQARRPDQRFGWQRILGNYSSSEYDSLQIVARRRFAQGFTFTSAYTYSRFLDDTSADAEFASRATLIDVGTNPDGTAQSRERPIRADYGSSLLEMPHVFNFSGIYDLPFGKGRRYALGNPAARAILGGWSLSSIVTFRTGNVFDVTTGTDYNRDGSFDDRPALRSGSLGDLFNRDSANKTQWLLPQAQATQRLGVPENIQGPFATIPRNAFRGPNFYNYDLSLLKNFAIGERAGLRFEANFFNIFNRANLSTPNGNLASAFFGRVTSTVNAATPRQIQFGLKLTF